VNLVASTGAELLIPNQAPPFPPNIKMIGDFEVTQVGYTKSDKPGKDNNFRGLTVFNNTFYVTKGSGGNGINTVYQVGAAGTLPTPTDAENAQFSILPGFPTTLASGTALDGSADNPVAFPFGIFFANASTLYVCDEGDGTLVTPARIINGQPNVADDSALATAGLQKWSLETDGNWHLLYVLQNGLNIGVPYSIANYPTALDPATGGCRNLTGRVNGDGTVDLFAITSTISANGDQGADPNQLVTVKDRLAATSRPNGNGVGLATFTTLRTARAGSFARHCVCAGAVDSLVPNEESGDVLPAESSMANPLAGVVGCCNVARQRERLCAPGHRAPFQCAQGKTSLGKEGFSP